MFKLLFDTSVKGYKVSKRTKTIRIDMSSLVLRAQKWLRDGVLLFLCTPSSYKSESNVHPLKNLSEESNKSKTRLITWGFKWIIVILATRF